MWKAVRSSQDVINPLNLVMEGDPPNVDLSKFAYVGPARRVSRQSSAKSLDKTSQKPYDPPSNSSNVLSQEPIANDLTTTSAKRKKRKSPPPKQTEEYFPPVQDLLDDELNSRYLVSCTYTIQADDHVSSFLWYQVSDSCNYSTY
jgi:hypothetical protein